MSDKNNTRIAALLLIILTVLVFQRVLNSEFITTDDRAYIANNPHVTPGLTLRGIGWAFTTGHSGNWHPLTWMSHMLDCSIYGIKPAGHHATNLLFHIASVLLLFLVLRRMTGRTWRSAFVAALFAVHPLHVESVAWAAERKDVLSVFFWMLTMLAYVRYVEHPRPVRYALVLLMFALGLMSKPVLVTLPFALLLLDYWPLGRKRRWTSLVWEKVPLFALSAASSAITYVVQQKSGAVSSLDELPFGVRAANAVVAYIAYLWKMLWPTNLAIMYPHPHDSLARWQVLGSALLLIVLAFIAIAGRKRRYLPVGWLWYLGTLVPMIGLVQVGAQAMADRYTYIPFIGLFIMIAWGVGEWGRLEKAKPIAACLIIAALAITARVQVGYWKDAYTVFTHANKVTHDNYLANNELGNVMANRGRLAESARYYSRALEIVPNAERSHLGLGVVLVRQGKLDEAIEHFKAAVAAQPEFAEAHFALARALADKGMPNESAEHFAKAIELDPKDARAYRGLGTVLEMQHKSDEVISAYRKAIEISPNDAMTHYKLAMVLIGEKDILGAVPHLEQAVHLDPTLAEAQLNLGIALASQGDLDSAISHFLKAVEAKPNYGRARESLAEAYYIKGDYQAAWNQVRLCLKYGYHPDPGFVQALSTKMPER